MAASPQEALITRLLRHLQLTAAPPLIVPTRSRHASFDWVAEDTAQSDEQHASLSPTVRGLGATGSRLPG